MKQIIILLTCISLFACSLFTPSPVPEPKIITGDLNQIAESTLVSIVNLVPLDIPNNTQTIINRNAVFRIATAVKAYPSDNIIIPQNSLITGIYTNDGKTCQISWQALYGNYRALELGQAVTAIATHVNNNQCNPKLGLRAGDILTLIFK